MRIRKYNSSNSKEVAKVIYQTFSKFNRNEGTKKGIKDYLNYYSPRKDIKELQKIFSKTPLALVAIKNNKIIGIIRGSKNRVTNLFVLGTYHKKGTGKALLYTFEKNAKKHGSKFIKIRSSLYAVSFYAKHGYKKTTGIRYIKGLRFQPMMKKL